MTLAFEEEKEYITEQKKKVRFQMKYFQFSDKQRNSNETCLFYSN